MASWVQDEAARQLKDFNDDTDINTAVREYGESCLRAGRAEGLREAARHLRVAVARICERNDVARVLMEESVELLALADETPDSGQGD